MNDTERVLELLRKAVAILESEPEPAAQVHEDEVTLEGIVGRPELKEVGADGIPLFTFGLKVRTPEGREQWVNAQAWRKVALWGANNLDSGSVVQVIGKWEKKSYNGRETPFFSVRLFQAT